MKNKIKQNRGFTRTPKFGVTPKGGGFTLIELLVVVSIISLLSSIVLSSINSARAKGRDARRKEDLVQLRTAIYSYYLDHNAYPAGLLAGAWNGVSTGSGCGTPADGSGDGTTSGARAYIQGLTPTYIATLPYDPLETPGAAVCTGYLYYSNLTDYKFMIANTPESPIPLGQQFADPARAPKTWAIYSEGYSGF